MSATCRLDGSQITSLLEQLCDDSISSNDGSETENVLLEGDIQSDVEDDLVDIQEKDENALSSQTLNTTPSVARIITVSIPTFRSKSGHCWSTSKGNSATRFALTNIVRTARGYTGQCKWSYDPQECFNVFFTDEIITEVVQWTNAEISINRRDDMTAATFRETNPIEIRALIGVLTLTAVLKDNHLTTEEVFNMTYCRTRYAAALSRDRFDYLIRHRCFDDKLLRQSLRPNDAFIPVRNIWNIFIKQCQSSYIPGSHTIIDEQLLEFRGRCPFKMFIPNKPRKYGIKIPMICDSTTKYSYMFNAIPYLGKTTKTCELPLGEYYVKELSRPMHGTCRNITCDNWFTSIPLAKSLLKEPYKLPEDMKYPKIRKIYEHDLLELRSFATTAR